MRSKKSKGQIFHPYWKWECWQNGFFNQRVEGMTADQCMEEYRAFLADSNRFSESLNHIITHWKHSCEHWLTNESMNRIAWLGQASACHTLHIPNIYRGGFNLLGQDQQDEANGVALVYLNKWMWANDRPLLTMDQAGIRCPSDF